MYVALSKQRFVISGIDVSIYVYAYLPLSISIRK